MKRKVLRQPRPKWRFHTLVVSERKHGGWEIVLRTLPNLTLRRSTTTMYRRKNETPQKAAKRALDRYIERNWPVILSEEQHLIETAILISEGSMGQ